MIRASDLTLRRGTKVLLDHTEFVVHPGERVGIVGKNGAGKTTLFALLTGKLDADSGSLDIPASWRVAAIAQEVAGTARPAREFVIDGDTTLRALQAERAALDASADDAEAHGHRLAELETALADAGAWSAQSRAEQLLAGLGFAPREWMLPVGQFSGGWRMRLNLARALMAPSDLLLLDEPTNHLDLDAMLWLERWLAAYPGTVILISHDTEFLDAVARTILHFDHAKLVRYKGGYQDFLVQRAERIRQTQIAIERQAKQAAHLQSFIDRFKAQATKAKQAQSRVKALARMEQLAPLRYESGIDIRIPSPTHTPDPLLTMRGVSAGYDAASPILRNVELMVRSGSRVGILGANGAGKSTLVKTLAGELNALGGELNASRGLQVGYFAQHQLDMLDLSASPILHLARLAPDTREQELRNYLGGFGIIGDAAMSPVEPMSGGEKARLALALIVWQKPNLLLLDEPSNHLDVDTREALTEALAAFEGSMLLVSHDRHLLRTTVDEFWIVADGGVARFEGDLEDYREWLASRARAGAQGANSGTATESDAPAEPDRRALRRQQAEARQRLSTLRKPIEQKLKRAEADMERVSARKAALDAMIADAGLYEDARRDERIRVLAEHGELTKQLETIEEDWLGLQGELEALDAEHSTPG
ncbi:ATP-binding cassette domain-containing protein [Achromobacter sp. GG226]|uniref:ABC-F family ATP-binding cassette domain-containing protein n=1 Tax=Verticiella alkaliphila TaxID=2779529 RepID=UPI001C0B4A29|nr:ATP-binding cassette domain-containing protein [Verticiella sp. GG226]MBU4612484.1 ATP-binding cassette domain-containing protein [Verticiella sp. GG226]